MLTLGITGGVASGKSLAAKYFAELGAVLFDADRAGHEILREPQVRGALVESFGSEILNSAGEIDRAAVAKRVFGSSPKADTDRRFLEELVHPLIRSRLEVERAQSAAGGSQVFVVEAALLLESGWDADCDLVIFVDAPQEVRQSRAATRGWSEEQFAGREAAQWPVEKKRQASDRVLMNCGTPQELQSRIQELWRELAEPVDSPKMP